MEEKGKFSHFRSFNFCLRNDFNHQLTITVAVLHLLKSYSCCLNKKQLTIHTENTLYQSVPQTLTIPRLTPRSSSGNSRDSTSLDCLIVRLPVPTSSQRFAWDTCRSWRNTHTSNTCTITYTRSLLGDDTCNNILQHGLGGEERPAFLPRSSRTKQ